MNAEELKQRTQDFALRIVRLVAALPKGKVADVISDQLCKAGTSVGANYRAACRARSSADFVAKLSIVEEEADETIYWLEILAESGLVKASLLAELLKEASELVAITVASINTAGAVNAPAIQSAIRNPHSAIRYG